MASLNFKGKSAVWNHHLSVPYHTLEKDGKKSLKGNDNTDNLIIEGDNLLALKALLPKYQDSIKCIYIDPPYNTGSAFEHYNDSVEHSLWLSLMRDRLAILKRLLREDGFIFVQIDNNEMGFLSIFSGMRV